MYLKNFKIFIVTIFFAFCIDAFAKDNIPSLIGTWTGKNNTLSEQRGFRTWEKKVEIIDFPDQFK